VNAKVIICASLAIVAIILVGLIPYFQNASAFSIFEFFNRLLFPHTHLGPEVVGNIKASNNASAVDSPTKCDESLWNHVYQSSRLQILNRCITVSGVVESIRSETDGDSHIRVKLDSQFTYLINAANIKDQFGDLVVEPICQHSVIQPNAFFACIDFHQNINIPPIGTHVKVAGSYVLDTWHDKWAEIHPVTSILPLR
jgi:hypothetical protein